MSPGVSEEAGQTARSFIEVMKTQPATLAMILSNVAMLIFIFYALHAGAQFRDSMIKTNFEQQIRMAELLSKCVVPDKP